MNHKDELRVRVDEVTDVADRIKRFRLVPLDRDRLPSFSGGAHITVNMEGEDRYFRNQYSLMSPPDRTDAYEVSVLRVEDSRGGSEFMHTRVAPGDTLWIGQPNNQFATNDLARRHLFVAGGIGITPFMSMMQQAERLGQTFELHYAIRSESHGAYVEDLPKAYGEQVNLYRADVDEWLPIAELVENQPLGTHLYVCGPSGLIDAVQDTARSAGWPEDSIHSEKFLAPPPGDPFSVSLARSEREVHVGEHESILEALEAADVDPPFLCRGGVCGQCESRVVACDGVLQHNDEFLTADERERGEQLMICMSRFKGKKLVLDL